MKIFTITIVKYQNKKHFYIDELQKHKNFYFWNEPDFLPELSLSTPIYFNKVSHSKILDDCSYTFKNEHLRFTTTIKKIKEKYALKNDIILHF